MTLQEESLGFASSKVEGSDVGSAYGLALVFEGERSAAGITTMALLMACTSVQMVNGRIRMRVRFWLSELYLWNLLKLHTPKWEGFGLP